MSTIGEYMTRDFWSVPPDLSVWSALAVMREHDVRHVLVVENEVLAGVLSNRDYRRLLERTGPDGSIHGLNDVVVSDVMTPVDRLVAVGRETPLLAAVDLIVHRQIGCLPVVNEQGRPVGLLTQKMLLRCLGDLLARHDAPASRRRTLRHPRRRSARLGRR